MIKISKKKEARDFTNITCSMSGEEIASVLGVQRQAVSNTLKRAMGKTYYGMKNLNDSKPFETMVHISLGFKIPEIEMKNFYKLFPKEIRKEIKEDAKKYRI